MPENSDDTNSETVLPEDNESSEGRTVPLLFGVKADAETLTRVQSRVNEMLTAIPPSQHKYFKTLLEHLHQALQPLVRDDDESKTAPKQTQVSYFYILVVQ
jgi:hypothetical protein